MLFRTLVGLAGVLYAISLPLDAFTCGSGRGSAVSGFYVLVFGWMSLFYGDPRWCANLLFLWMFAESLFGLRSPKSLSAFVAASVLATVGGSLAISAAIMESAGCPDGMGSMASATGLASGGVSWVVAIALLSALYLGKSWLLFRKRNPVPRIRKTEEPRIVRDAISAAESMSQTLSAHGYNADFSVESLREVDRFLEEHAPAGKPIADGLLGEYVGPRLFGLGAYAGETIRRSAGGTWKGDDADPRAEINVSIELTSGTVFWPVQRVMNKFQTGSEDGVYVYGLALTRPEPPT